MPAPLESDRVLRRLSRSGGAVDAPDACAKGKDVQKPARDRHVLVELGHIVHRRAARKMKAERGEQTPYGEYERDPTRLKADEKQYAADKLDDDRDPICQLRNWAPILVKNCAVPAGPNTNSLV